jgi:hypothetical protein
VKIAESEHTEKIRERRNIMSAKASDSEERLNSHPILKKRIQSLSEIIGDRSGNYNTADDAGEKIIEEVRHPGNELMHIWASEKESAGVEEIKSSENITGHGKKNCHGIRHSEK